MHAIIVYNYILFQTLEPGCYIKRNNSLLFDSVSSCHLLDKVKHNIITKPNCDRVKSHSNSVGLQYIIGNIMCITD